jgi:tetratricopeptide (TPR) repeat protein
MLPSIDFLEFKEAGLSVMVESFDFYDEQALLERLSTGIRKRRQEIVFLVGAPLSAPVSPGGPGVPDVDGMIDLIRQEFDGEPTEQAALEQELVSSGAKKYQAAFFFLQGRRGQQTANEIIIKAVLAAREPGPELPIVDFTNHAAAEAACRLLELDNFGWHINVGTEYLGKLVAGYPNRFGNTLLTTNFDPLIETSIRRASGSSASCYRTVLHSDGNLSQTEAPGCHVIHLHGYWFGADTLHTARQLGQSRPHLRDSLRSILRNKLVVVCAYSGWDDVFTDALMDVVRDLTEHPQIIWTFFSGNPKLDETLSKRLEPGIDRARITLYAGIDCNRLFPQLFQRWANTEEKAPFLTTLQSNPVRVTESLLIEVQAHREQQTVIEGNDEDRPPVVEICVGRGTELQRIQDSDARVIFLNGMGGEGKSTVAAQYFTTCQSNRSYSLYVWRDCKEERERLENQLSSVIERLSDGRVSGEDLAQQSAESIVEILVDLIRARNVLFTFDNVDHYVNLETGKMTGTPDVFIKALLRSGGPSRAVFTCRPRVQYDDNRVLSIHLEGLSLDASVMLFSRRQARSSYEEIVEAHELTKGHAFWLDLLAIQVGKQHGATTLQTLVTQISSGSGLLPEKTLHSIWGTLKAREQTVLRAMAETVKPETEMVIGDYLSSELTFNKVMRSLNNLRTLNLVVVKKRPNGADLLELHPLVRRFIRSNFPEKERLSFIKAIISAYQKWIGSHKAELRERPSLVALQYWTQSAELDIAAGQFQEAFSILAEVGAPFIGSAYPREFTRTVRNLLEATDWVSNHGKYKDFEFVFRIYMQLLAELGEYSEASSLLDKYGLTVGNRDARYINYCDLRCYAFWVRGEFAEAVSWGKTGQELKTSTGVDTTFDVSHNFALALRDAGRPESALQIFLLGRKVTEVIDKEELDERRGGHYYGNIGRCLHFMGQIDEALVCYQKSALLLEKAPTEHVKNQGFIRAWIAELLLARKEPRLAYAFYRAAYLKWQQTAPPRAAQVEQASLQLRTRVSDWKKLDDTSVNLICLDWILGKSVDASQ